MTGTQEDSTNHHRVKRYDALVEAERLPETVQRIVNEFDPLKIILFGSHVRGEANRWSDIDLLVVFDKPVDKRRRAIEIQRLLNGYLVSVDVVVTWSEEISCIWSNE